MLNQILNNQFSFKYLDDDDNTEETSRSKLNIQTSENFDEHLSSNCVEFDDTSSGIYLNKTI